jgi:hypothetical protein
LWQHLPPYRLSIKLYLSVEEWWGWWGEVIDTTRENSREKDIMENKNKNKRTSSPAGTTVTSKKEKKRQLYNISNLL